MDHKKSKYEVLWNIACKLAHDENDERRSQLSTRTFLTLLEFATLAEKHDKRNQWVEDRQTLLKELFE